MAKLSKEQVDKVTNFLAMLVDLAVKASIIENGYFNVENERHTWDNEVDEDEDTTYYVGEGDRFSIEVESKYQLQISECYQSEAYATDHTMVMELKGHLAEIFLANDIETNFEVWMENGDGEPIHIIYDAGKFKQNLHFPKFHSLENKDFNSFDSFFEDITKPFIFEILKKS